MRSLLCAAALGLGLLAFVGPAARAADKPTVAVLYFDYDGKDDSMALLKKGLAQMLISDLSGQDSIHLVERERLEAILAELKLGQSGKIDSATAAKVGKLVGARYLVVGGYFDVMGTLRVDARVVEVETGRIVQSVGASGKPEEFLAVEQKLATELEASLARDLKLPPTPSPASGSKLPEGAHARPRAPAKLNEALALRYSAALNQIDLGHREEARETLKQVVKEQPDFQLAAIDLDKMMQ